MDYPDTEYNCYSEGRQRGRPEMVKEGLHKEVDPPRTNGKEHGDPERDLLSVHSEQCSNFTSLDSGRNKRNSRRLEQGELEQCNPFIGSSEDQRKTRMLQALDLEARKIMNIGLPLNNSALNIMKNYIRWGLSWKFGEDELVPANEVVLYYYITWLSRSVACGTILSYILAVIDLHVRAGFSDYGTQFKGMIKIKRLLLALQNKDVERTGKNIKQALEVPVIIQLARHRLEVAKSDPAEKINCVLTVFLIALWTGLRSDNLVAKARVKFTTKRQLHSGCLINAEKGFMGSLELHKTRKKTKEPVVFSIPEIKEVEPSLANLCAATAIKELTAATGVGKAEQLLTYKSRGKLVPLNCNTYLKTLWHM